MKTPKVSVVTPAYNSEKYIAEAIDSILNQTFTDFEFVIIDDCSTDKTWEIIQQYAKKDKRIVAIKNEENLGISRNRNKGINNSNGEYIALLDNDDWSYPDRLEKQVAFLDNNPDIGIVGGAVEMYNENFTKLVNKTTLFTDDTSLKKYIFRQIPLVNSSIMFRKQVSLKASFDENLSPAEDYDFFFRVGQLYKFANLKDIVLKYRTSQTQQSTKRNNYQQYLSMYIRLKAIVEYGYKPSKSDVFITLLKLIFIPIFPKKVKDALFNIIFKGPSNK